MLSMRLVSHACFPGSPDPDDCFFSRCTDSPDVLIVFVKAIQDVSGKVMGSGSVSMPNKAAGYCKTARNEGKGAMNN